LVGMPVIAPVMVFSVSPGGSGPVAPPPLTEKV